MTTLRRAAFLGCVTLLAASVARAQTQPPPAPSTPPPATAPAAPPAASLPAAAAPAPVEPLSPTMAPDPNAPPLLLTERTTPEQQAPRPEPLYRKVWFWAAVSVVVATVTLILVWNLSSTDNGPPETTFGNMHAF